MFEYYDNYLIEYDIFTVISNKPLYYFGILNCEIISITNLPVMIILMNIFDFIVIIL